MGMVFIVDDVPLLLLLLSSMCRQMLSAHFIFIISVLGVMPNYVSLYGNMSRANTLRLLLVYAQ